MASDRSEYLRKIPSVDELMGSRRFDDLVSKYSRSIVVDSVRKSLQELRAEILESDEADLTGISLSDAHIADRVSCIAEGLEKMNLRRVINATGIILHTGLGRAVLSERARGAIDEAARSYSSLEMDLESGERGRRDNNVIDLLCELTGAESATVVNNNAAATMIILKTLACGSEVIVSRGQLVEIGGSYRIPDVMKESGAVLVEVGTTNRTHLKDYRNAITEKTAALLHVHMSNYRIVGFTKQVATSELVELGREHHIPVVDDLGSGAFVDYTQYGLAGEPTVQASIKAGADVVCFSGDKLLGGPQAGIILGRKEIIEKIRKNPLARAVRVGKLTLSALEATLRLFRDPETLLKEHAGFRMVSQSKKDIKQRANGLAEKLQKRLPDTVELALADGFSQMGGGSLAGEDIPTTLLAVKMPGRSPDEAAKLLRMGDPPVICRIRQDALMFDLRTVQPSEEDELADAVVKALSN